MDFKGRGADFQQTLFPAGVSKTQSWSCGKRQITVLREKEKHSFHVFKIKFPMFSKYFIIQIGNLTISLISPTFHLSPTVNNNTSQLVNLYCAPDVMSSTFTCIMSNIIGSGRYYLKKQLRLRKLVSLRFCNGEFGCNSRKPTLSAVTVFRSHQIASPSVDFCHCVFVFIWTCKVTPVDAEISFFIYV